MSPTSTSLYWVQENTLGSTPYSDINTSIEMVDKASFRALEAQPDTPTTPLNHELESQRLSTSGNTRKRGCAYRLKKADGSWWLWEAGGAALSIGCMVAILIITPYIDNKPLERWHSVVAPNTLISTLITVSKTSMLLAVAGGLGQLKWQHFHRDTRPIAELDMYDEATRGPWGALKFIIFSPSSWIDITAIIGSFIMLSSLTMEPLAQQVLSFQTRHMRQGNGSAWIATTTSYLQEPYKNPDFRVEARGQSLVLQGLLGSVPPLSYTCSSSNCSWPDFHALGVCSSCSNVTLDTSVNDMKTPISYLVPNTKNYTTPKGMTLALSDWTFFESAIVMSGNATREGMTKLQDIAFVAIGNASSRPEKYTQVDNYDEQADITECTISWCAKFYSDLKFTNGILNAYTMEERGFSSEKFHKDYLDIEDDPLERCYNGSGNVTFGAKREEESYSFGVGCGKASGVAEYFLNLFKFQVSSDKKAFASGQLLMSSESIPRSMDAMAEAFSIYLMVSALNTTRHYGEAFYPEVFVVINWQWLLFPFFLTILGACFLGTSLLRSWKNRESFYWKDSLVALLFHGLSKRGNNDEGPDEKTEMDERAGLITAKPKTDKDDVYPNGKIEMDELAEDIRAKLEDDGGSLKFMRA